jgi:hypothetical protein
MSPGAVGKRVMGARRWVGRAAVVAAILGAGARAEGGVEADPIARLSVESGYDSNVRYDGRGGDGVGVLSPELGFDLRDHLWSAKLVAGGDLLLYRQRAGAPVWNQRGSFRLRARPEERWEVTADVAGTYAFDPLGLARMGIFTPPGKGAALLVRGRGRAAWRASHLWQAALTFSENAVRWDDRTGALAHTPGVEVTRRLGHRLELGGAYRFDWFQGFGAGSVDALAHEAVAIARYRLTRHLDLNAEGGVALWRSQGDSAVPLEAAVQLIANGRNGDGAWLQLRHGVGLGLTATPGLFDSVEAAVTRNVGPLVLHADGGVWRSGEVPWGANAVVGYGIEGEVGWRLGRSVTVGLGASRFARADTSSSLYDRNTVGLRLRYELGHPARRH